MRLTDTINKIKVSTQNMPDIPKDLFVLGLILLTGLGSFMLGRLSLIDEKHKTELRILSVTNDENNVKTGNFATADSQYGVVTQKNTASLDVVETTPAGMYVGSKSGSTYYLPWCSGVKRIHEENKIWFQNKAEAVNKGYKPSRTCKGI